MQDIFLLLIHTAERKSTVLSMAWEDIDWINKIWNIPDIKNGKSRSLFLTDEAIEILYRRKQKSKNPCVFPSLKSETGHFVQPQPAWDRIVEKARLKGLTIDDLRKTMEKLIEQLRASIKIL